MLDDVDCFCNDHKLKVKHVLTGQIPSQQQTLGHCQQLWLSSPSKLPVKYYGSETNFWRVNCNLDHGDITLSHDTMFEISPRSSMTVRNGSDTDFGYVFTVTSTCAEAHDTPVG